MKKIIVWLLALCLLLTGCRAAAPVRSGEDLMKNVKPSNTPGFISIGTNFPQTMDPETDEVWDNVLVADFGVRLFQSAMEPEKNILISPVSVLAALAMTANGADAETLDQMEAVLGQSTGALNSWYRFGMTQNDTLHLANGIWFRDDPALSVEDQFLRTNADYYGAGVYKAPFDDSTVADINRFVEENTNGMIKNILQEIPEEAVMYLVNALAFDAKWQEVYMEHQVNKGHFTTEDGRRQNVELMYSTEHGYLENTLATGFLKPYQNGRYAFAALLPKEGVSVAECVRSLTGEELRGMLANPQSATVDVALPKFETGFDTQLSDVLKTMGMTAAFDPEQADFSRMGSSTEGTLYISQVLHKTFISVAEQGTKAGAATAVDMAAGAALIETEIKQVILDRPFVYMILDRESNVPVFMGTMMDPAEE